MAECKEETVDFADLFVTPAELIDRLTKVCADEKATAADKGKCAASIAALRWRSDVTSVEYLEIRDKARKLLGDGKKPFPVAEWNRMEETSKPVKPSPLGDEPASGGAPKSAEGEGGGIKLPLVHGAGSRWAGQPIRDRIENTEAVINFHRAEVKYNEMTLEQEILVPGKAWHIDRTNNASFAYVRELCRKYDVCSSREVLREHLELLQKPYHPVRDWILSKPWDKQDRFQDVFKSITWASDQDIDLAKELMYRWMLGAVAVVMDPKGSRLQGILILQGAGATNKTRWFASLVPNDDWFGEGVLLDPASRDSKDTAERYWITELGEIDSTFRRDIAALKAYITSKKDNRRAAYDPRGETHYRRTVFCGTVNPANFLVDPDGNRRYWTTSVLECNPAAVGGIDLQQLWAQMEEAFRTDKRYWLDKMTEAKLNASNERFEIADPMGEQVAAKWVVSTCVPPVEHTTEQIKVAINNKEKWTERETRALTSYLRRKMGLTPRKSNGLAYWRVEIAPTEAERKERETQLRLLDAAQSLDLV